MDGGYFFTVVRTVFITCVPLFLILSGYLCCKKTLSKGYYRGLTKVVLTYVIAGLFCQFVDYILHGGDLLKIVLTFFSFKAAPYGWYIEMYFGLFLIIPFLNILWDKLNDIQRKWLLITLLLTTSVPCIFNSFNFSNTNMWWYATQSDYTKLYPDYFINVYPITYYVIGVYLHERMEKIRGISQKRIVTFLCCAVLVLEH